MVFSPGKYIPCIHTRRLAIAVLIISIIELFLELSSIAIEIAAQVEVLGRTVSKQGADLSCHNICCDLYVMDPKIKIISIQDPHIAHCMVQTIDTQRSRND